MPTHRFIIGDVIEALKTIPDESVHCCVTSPPYWGLRDYGVDGQLGLEPTPEKYISKMVDVFREVKRVLRKDGTLWLNLGDSYLCQQGKGFLNKHLSDADKNIRIKRPEYLKPKDLVGVPWMVAFALRNDGWYLRSDIIWAKPNPMPESVRDRPTKAHEYVFLLAKSEKYFYDADAIREPFADERMGNPGGGGRYMRMLYPDNSHAQSGLKKGIWTRGPELGGRNKRSVWTIATESFPDAHFATFPTALVEPCIKAGTSEKGCCPKCGSPWERVVEPTGEYAKHLGGSWQSKDKTGKGSLPSGIKTGHYKSGWCGIRSVETQGWRPTCSCGIEETIPCTVLDPFGGAGTVSLVAKRLGRSSIYIDINPTYAEIAKRRLKLEQQSLFTEHTLELFSLSSESVHLTPLVN